MVDEPEPDFAEALAAELIAIARNDPGRLDDIERRLTEAADGCGTWLDAVGMADTLADRDRLQRSAATARDLIRATRDYVSGLPRTTH
jgi:hypothetical protein